MSGIPRTESLVDEDNYHNSRDSPNSMLEEFYDAPEDSPKPPDKRPSKGSSGPNSQRNSLEGTEQYINLKNFSGLTSPLKLENPHDDVSSLSSFSVENPERQDSKDSSIRDVPTPKRVSSAMKLFKNIEANNEPDDEDNEADEVAPPSTAPERYAFNHQSLSRRGIVAEVTDTVYDASNEIKNEDRRSAPRPPSIPRSSQHLSNPPIPKRHDSLKRRSVTVNEEVFLTSALFGLNDFQSTMQGSTPAMPSSSANPHHHSMTGSSATDLFKDKLRLAQTLNAHEGSVWAMKFSPNGQYLASGGQDTRVIIWCIAQLPKSTKQFEGSDSPLQSSANSVDEGEDGDQGKHRQSHSNSAAPSLIHSFLFPEPYRIYEGHTHDITDLAWSKSNFVLSSSMDKTVRLWHVSRNDCLQYFRHPDIVTCVDFHPLHDRFFVSGCFDRRLRVWDIIPTGSVREWVSANDTITAVSFSPDGLTVAGGLIQGQIFFYEYEGMKYKTQMDCRNRSGKYKKGCKVSGIAYYQKKDLNLTDSTNSHNTSSNTLGSLAASSPSGTHSASFFTANTMTSSANTNLPNSGNEQAKTTQHNSFFKKKGPNFSTNQLLVTTNDNRIRLCSLEDYSTFCKFKGLKNRSMQIKATFSDDCEYIICGSEYGQVFIWKTLDEHIHSNVFSNFFLQKDVLRNKLYENFDANEDGSAVIAAVFSPIESVRRYVKAHKDLLGEMLTNPAVTQFWVNNHRSIDTNSPHLTASMSSAGGNNNTSTNNINDPQRRNSWSKRYDLNSMQLATRVVCTADFNGQIRVFFRVN